VQLLAEQGMLAAVALEMAEQGTSTTGLAGERERATGARGAQMA
jgi:hypothetical protein